MATVQNKMSVSSGHIKNTKAKVHAAPGDNVEWTSADGDFAVSFVLFSPFDAVDFRGAQNTTVTATVRADAVPGRYKYSAAIATPAGVFMDDPEVIIET